MYNLMNLFNKTKSKRSKRRSKGIKTINKSKCRTYNIKTKKCNYLKGG